MKSKFKKVVSFGSLTICSSALALASQASAETFPGYTPPAVNPVNLSIGVALTPNGTTAVGLAISETGANTRANASASSSVLFAPDGTTSSFDVGYAGGYTSNPQPINYYIFTPTPTVGDAPAVPGYYVP